MAGWRAGFKLEPQKREVHTVARTRVVLLCEPLLLQDALIVILGQLPDVEVLPADSATADIVLVSSPGSNSGWPAQMPPAAATAPRVVALDPIRNMLRVREWQQGQVTERQIDGHMAAVVDVMHGTPASFRPPIASTG